MKVKFFTWLAVKGRIWTADRRHRRGLTTDTDCRLCDQEVETADHLLCTCSFTKQVWHSLFTALGYQNPPPVADCFLEWWLTLRQDLSNEQKKGLDTAVMRLLDGVKRAECQGV